MAFWQRVCQIRALFALYFRPQITFQVVPVPMELAGALLGSIFRVAKKQEPPLVFHKSSTEEDLKDVSTGKSAGVSVTHAAASLIV